MFRVRGKLFDRSLAFHRLFLNGETKKVGATRVAKDQGGLSKCGQKLCAEIIQP